MASIMKEFEPLKIHLEELKKATNSFSSKVIGVGGFGKVYEGEVSHSKGRSMVAIKRFCDGFGQGEVEFRKEIMMLSCYTHKNLISLLGFCDQDGEKILVYEHASNGSFDRHLSSTALTWTQRLKICLDVAMGIAYLHDHKDKTLDRIIFKDHTSPMDPTSLEIFSDIAFQCLQNSSENRPTASLLVEKLEIALNFQEHQDVGASRTYGFVDEVNALFSKGKGLFIDQLKTMKKMYLEQDEQEEQRRSIHLVYPLYPGRQASRVQKHVRLGKVIHAVYLIIAWSIWKSRNEKIFKNKDLSDNNVLEDVKEKTVAKPKSKKRLRELDEENGKEKKQPVEPDEVVEKENAKENGKENAKKDDEIVENKKDSGKERMTREWKTKQREEKKRRMKKSCCEEG
ncbi:hypothetical protein L1987_49918 [Smallanthus sonchifolius]|uniref:Uncharacterized protein n=1 Tax=Smallanthus sonchifolius TaxID=185202 RepID=A0ACB9FX31_9ASTR|nr:hypothetical protein L1987_49918 [Smallanthus sonchifolius]